MWCMVFEFWNAVHPFCSFTFLQRSMVCLGLPLLPLTSRNSLGTKSCWSKYRNSTCEMSTVAPCISGLFFCLSSGTKGWFNLFKMTLRKHEILVKNRILSSWLVSSGQVSMSRIANSMVPDVFIDLSVLWGASIFSVQICIYTQAPTMNHLDKWRSSKQGYLWRPQPRSPQLVVESVREFPQRRSLIQTIWTPESLLVSCLCFHQFAEREIHELGHFIRLSALACVFLHGHGGGSWICRKYLFTGKTFVFMKNPTMMSCGLLARSSYICSCRSLNNSKPWAQTRRWYFPD